MGSSFFAFAQISEEESIGLVRTTDPRSASLPESRADRQESVTASYKADHLFIRLDGFRGTVTVEVFDANDARAINDAQKISKQSVLVYSISELKPGWYTLVVKASSEYLGEFYKYAHENIVFAKESCFSSSLCYR